MTSCNGQASGIPFSPQSIVQSNEHLYENEKFNYLNSLLEHAAKEAILGFALIAANYHNTISTLKKRVGVKQRIVDKHLDVATFSEIIEHKKYFVRPCKKFY